jgi:hypothetical protein
MTSTMRFDKWENSLGQPYGTVLQVVSANYSTAVITTSTSYVTTGLSASITPSSTSSKIVVLAETGGRTLNNGSVGTWTIFRGTIAGVDLATGLGGASQIYGGAAGELLGKVSATIVDSPSTTSSQTYTFAFKANSGGTVTSQINSTQASITLMEIAQ